MFCRPTLTNTRLQRSVVQPCLHSPIQHTKRSPVNCDQFVCSSVSRLIDHRIPNTVIRAVAFIVVHAFNNVFKTRPWPHIFIKIFKRIPPSFTNTNSTSAVVVVIGTVRIQAPCFDSRPNLVFRAIRHIVPFSAGATAAVNKRCCLYWTKSSTITAAEPIVVNTARPLCGSRNRMRVAQNGPIAVSTPDGRSGIFSFSQGVTSCTGTLKVRAALSTTAQAACLSL